MPVFLSPSEFDASVEKIAKINARAVKRGFTGRYEIVGTPAVRVETLETGHKITRHGYEAEVTGEPPKYNGYTLLASLDWEEAGVVVHTAPGVEKVDRDLIVKGQCVHCKVNRRRVKGYLVGTEAGEQLQVGSTCIKDFLGWDGSVVFHSQSDVEDDLDWGGGGWGDPLLDTLDVLALSWSMIVELGYVRANEPGATKDAVDDMLSGRTRAFDSALLDRLRARHAESVPKAVEIRDWIVSDAFSGNSEYVQNLKVIAAGETLGWKSLGLLVSAPQTYLRSQEREAAYQAKNADRLNEWVGAVKDRIDVVLTVDAVRFIEGHYGTTTLYTMRDGEGRSFKWFASNRGLGDDPIGQTFSIRGTVKKLDEYQGVKSTVLTRCVVLEGANA